MLQKEEEEDALKLKKEQLLKENQILKEKQEEIERIANQFMKESILVTTQ